MITDRPKLTITEIALYGMFSFQLPLGSIQHNFPALYEAYKKPTHIFGNVQCPILRKQIRRNAAGGPTWNKQT